MKDAYAMVSLVRLCRLLGVTRQSYYQHFWQLEATGIEECLVLEKVHSIRKYHRAMGVENFMKSCIHFYWNIRSRWVGMRSSTFFPQMVYW